ncbi:MAG: 2OG-Fe(II) oxygenase [Sphingomicrobium sp.]
MSSDPDKPFYEAAGFPFAEQHSELRAGIGRNVGATLDSRQGLWRLCSPRAAQLYLCENFLTPDECRGINAQIDAGSYPSPLHEKEKHDGVRTSHSCNLNIYDPLIADVETRIANLLGIERSWGEPLQGQRYEVGQCFKDHVDFFYIDQPYWAEYEPRGGQRTWTAMIYLSDSVVGGGTRFGLLDLEIKPRLGRLLIWNNMAADGEPNGWMMHAGQPVEDGVKYIVTKWYRERTVV